MNRRFATSILSVLIYTQALLAFAGLVTVVIKAEAGWTVEVAALETPATTLR